MDSGTVGQISSRRSKHTRQHAALEVASAGVRIMRRLHHPRTGRRQSGASRQARAAGTGPRSGRQLEGSVRPSLGFGKGNEAVPTPAQPTLPPTPRASPVPCSSPPPST